MRVLCKYHKILLPALKREQVGERGISSHLSLESPFWCQEVARSVGRVAAALLKGTKGARAGAGCVTKSYSVKTLPESHLRCLHELRHQNNGKGGCLVWEWVFRSTLMPLGPCLLQGELLRLSAFAGNLSAQLQTGFHS